MIEYKRCDICKKRKDDVRFEALSENFICDSCLADLDKLEEEND